MIPLIKLKENLRFVRDIRDMVDVLKAATAAHFRTLQNRRPAASRFRGELDVFFESLEAGPRTHPFLREHPGRPKAVVMLTSDEGFLGGLNALVVQAGLEQAAETDELVVLGERGARYLSETQGRVFTVLPGIGDDIAYERAVSLRDFLLEKFFANKIGAVIVAFARFLSLTSQRPEAVRLLPAAEIFAGRRGAQKTAVPPHEILMEPDATRVVDGLVRAHLAQRFYDIFWESKLAECAARIMHLESSYEEIMSLAGKLNYEYFKHIHARSDKNIREIFASRLRWKEA